MSAWGSGDRAFLTLLTTAATAHQLLDNLGDPDQHWTSLGGDGAAGSTYTRYYNQDGDQITIRTSNAEVAAHHWHAGSVQTWDPMAYPSGDVAYVKEFVGGWIAGNKTRMELLATQSLTTHLLSLPTPSSGFTATELPGSDTAHRDVRVVDATTSLDLKLSVNVGSLGAAHAIEDCDPTCS